MVMLIRIHVLIIVENYDRYIEFIIPFFYFICLKFSIIKGFNFFLRRILGF
jgi:hypothetical protein